MSLALAGTAAHAVSPLRTNVPMMTDQLIIKYRDDTMSEKMVQAAAEAAPSLGLAQAAAARHGVAMSVARRTATRAVVTKLDRRLPEHVVARIAAEIAESDPSVLYAEPDRVMRHAALPNDPQLANQWHYTSAAPGGANVQNAWGLSTGSGVVVAVLDTGYRPHADLNANIVAGYDFIHDAAVGNDGNGRDSSALDPGDWVAADECGAGSDASDSSWHGTHVAGTIAAVTNNGVGVAGVAYGAKVQPVRVLGKCGGYNSDIADAIIWASGGSVAGVPANATPARVINLSLGGYGACDATTQAAVNAARSRNTVVVVAAGNSADNVANYSPASCTGVITVASVGRQGSAAYYTNSGDAVVLAAPGGDQSWGNSDGVLSTLNAGTQGPGADNYAYYQGTSMAAPHVAGVAALMISRNPALIPNGVQARMRTALKFFPGSCSGCGGGILDAYWSVVGATASSMSEREPNNVRGTATAVLSKNSSVNASVSGTDVTDYYKVVLPGRTTLRASLAPTASTNDFDLSMEDAAGVQLGSSAKSAGLTDRVIYRNATGSSKAVYIKVVKFGSSAGTYALAVNW
ncbi:S8 family peptidase [Ideonella sp.]|uniref:S8 family peptidase n=1 Tax=Ideonella sp. TaxID=1929293 RepID=UPI0035B2B73F